MKITSMWIYRLQDVETKFGLSLQVWSAKNQDWVHMRYFNRHKITLARLRYQHTMNALGLPPNYLEFTFNNLLELSTLISHNFNTAIAEMLADVCKILEIELEVIP